MTGGTPLKISLGLLIAGGTLNVRVALDPFDWDLSYSGRSQPNGYGITMAYDYVLQYAGEDNLVIGSDYGHNDTVSSWTP